MTNPEKWGLDGSFGLHACSRCPELCASRTQVVAPEPGACGLLCLGEAPGADEDRSGFGFFGRAGRTLDLLLAEHNLARHEYGRANIVRCRPPANRKPTRSEREQCEPLLLDFLRQSHPRVILAVGATAAELLCGKAALLSLIRHPEQAHPSAHIAALLREIDATVVPMPHTSPLAWNRNAPDGRKWAAIGSEQVRVAVRLLGRAQ